MQPTVRTPAEGRTIAVRQTPTIFGRTNRIGSRELLLKQQFRPSVISVSSPPRMFSSLRSKYDTRAAICQSPQPPQREFTGEKFLCGLTLAKTPRCLSMGCYSPVRM